MMNSRCVAGFLQPHLEIKQVDDDLCVALWLHAASHQAETDEGFSIPGDEGRNDGVEWELSGFRKNWGGPPAN